MLIFKDGKFHAGGAVFSVPNGFYIKTSPQEWHENGLEIRPPDESYVLSMYATESGLGVYRETELDFSGLLHSETAEILPITVYGLSGCQCCGTDGIAQLYEVRLELPTGLQFVFAALRRGGPGKIYNIPEIKWTLGQVMPER